jgi:hypothetical protein
LVYLIDASALVLHFVKNPPSELIGARRRIARLITSRPEGSGQTLYVPNFCIAECSKAFSRIFIADGVGEDKYRREVDALLDLVSSKRQNVVKPCELRREHFVDIEDVFLADRRLSRRDNEKPLSGLDGLVIAMGRTLTKDHSRVCVVTAEKRMARVCQSDPGLFPPAVCIIRDEIPGL